MLSELIQFNHQANLTVINTFLKAEKPISEAERLFSHILNSQHIWISRINYVEPSFERFQLQPLTSFKSLQEMCTQDLLRILEERNLQEEISYANSQGGNFVNRISDILYHVVNHSTYHRGQVATLFRANNVQPPVTDYVIMKREGRI